jgi:alkaline phosphatase
MHETMAFDRAIERAIEMVDFEDTLIIVTADHSHVMTMAGYPSRGTDIRGRFWF